MQCSIVRHLLCTARPQTAPQTTDAAPASRRESDGEKKAGPSTAEEWVELLVAEMTAAKDVADARSRGQRFLQHFEEDTTRRVSETDMKEITVLRQQLSDALRDNGILKRAVSIQNQRMQVRGPLPAAVLNRSPPRTTPLTPPLDAPPAPQEAHHKDQEIAQLREVVQKYQEQLEALQLSNYSLSVHLRHAFSPAPDRPPPDVF